MVQSVETPYADAVSSFLDTRYDEVGLSILDVLRDRYGINPWKYGPFRTISRRDELNLYYLNSNNQLEVFRYFPSTKSLNKLTSLTYNDVCLFILECSEDDPDRLRNATGNGALGVLGAGLSRLLPITPKDASQMISQLPRPPVKAISQIVLPSKNN
ncbi:MAG: hypothetical protein QG639_977 [Patescibacteria group bacterium]|nr:hypothetical protein [Patescibacteria group bacterium]